MWKDLLMLDMDTMGISRLAGFQNHCVPTASCNERALGHSHRALNFHKKMPKIENTNILWPPTSFIKNYPCQRSKSNSSEIRSRKPRSDRCQKDFSKRNYPSVGCRNLYPTFDLSIAPISLFWVDFPLSWKCLPYPRPCSPLPILSEWEASLLGAHLVTPV